MTIYKLNYSLKLLISRLSILLPVFLILLVSGCSRYNAEHFGCECAPVNEKFEGGYVFMPNIFTPSGDGINDFLEIKSKGVSHLNLVVENNVGQVEYVMNNLEIPSPLHRFWDGQHFDGDIHLGVYHYILSFKTPAGEQRNIKGKVACIPFFPPGSKNYMDLGCIEHMDLCVFASQWKNQQILPLDSSDEIYWLNTHCR